MRVSLYLDEAAQDSDLIEALRLRGVAVVATGRRGSESLSLGRRHAGMVLAKQQHYSVVEQMRRLLRLIETKSAEGMKDRIEFLSVWG